MIMKIQSIVLSRFKMILTIPKATIILRLKSLNLKDFKFTKKVNMKTYLRTKEKTKMKFMQMRMKNSVILQSGNKVQEEFLRHHVEDILPVLMKLFASIQIRKLNKTAFQK